MNNHNRLKGISNLNRCEIIALTNSVALILADGLDNDDLTMLGSILNAIADTISAFGAIKET
ncbi:MAG: hypothetical protein FWF94_02435 [Oscillospiraceae bacterium]|nr:hypothetical protein [Oscillospiraceae bacterium]